MSWNFIDLTDRKFGRWTVIHREYPHTSPVKWICQCDCGEIRSVYGRYLKSGRSISCGCFMKDLHTKHNECGTKFYNVWIHMKHRCHNPNMKEFHNYGGRGITVCDRWLDYLNFREDMYQSYIEHRKINKTTTLERKDVNGNYEPNNCKWATIKEQCENKRSNQLFVAVNKKLNTIEVSKNQKQFAILNNLNPSCINNCLRNRRKTHNGWRFKYILWEG